jgi:PAS domain S-box-containing protein
MGARVHAFDWSATPLGPMADWPAALRTATSIVLASAIPSVLLWGKALTVAAYNDAYLLQLGGKPEALGRSLLEVWAEAREVIAPQLARAQLGETVSVKDARFTLLRNVVQEEALFDYSFSPVLDETGQVAGVLNTSIEITARVRAEVGRAESEARLRVALEVGELGAFEWDLRAETVQPSDRARQIFGFAPSEGHDPADYVARIAPEELGQVEVDVQTGLALGRVEAHYHIRLPDGGIRYVRSYGRVLRDGDGAPQRVIGIFLDETERDRAEARLRESEARWRGLFENMHEGFAHCEIVYGPDGRAEDYRHLEVNDAALRLTGLSRQELLGRRASEAMPGLERMWTDAFARVVETGEPAHIEHRAAPLGRWFEVIAYRTEPGRFGALFLNITERKAAEERQAMLSREVDHRAKNALAVVQAALRLTSAPDLPNYVRAIEGRVAALARAQTLLADDRWAGADLHTLLRGELAAFVEGDVPRVELRGPPVALPAGTAQPFAMAVHELATNAVKYGALSTPAGRVTVHWDLDGSPDATLRLRWSETGGPPVRGEPRRHGFGTRLLRGTVGHQLGGAVSKSWQTSGLVCTIEVSLGRALTAAERAAVDPAPQR